MLREWCDVLLWQAEELVLKTVLKTTASKPFPFDVVLVEAERGDNAKNERVRELLRGAGLVQLSIEPSPGSFNDLFARPSYGDPRVPFSKAMHMRAGVLVRKHLQPLLRSSPLSPEVRKLVQRNSTATMLALRLMRGMPKAVAALEQSEAL